MMTSKKITLQEIDREDWVFILYKDQKENFYMDIVYSPQSFIQLSMLIKLTEEEKIEVEKNHENAILLANKVSHYFKKYLDRSLSKTLFIIP